MKQTTKIELSVEEVCAILAEKFGLKNAELTEGDGFDDTYIIEGDKVDDK